MRALKIVALVAGMTLAGAACGSGDDSSAAVPDNNGSRDSDTSAAAEEPIDLTIATFDKTLLNSLPLLVAEERGMFEEAGINVQINAFQTGSLAAQTVVAGDADLGYGGFDQVLAARAQGQDVKMVGVVTDTTGALIVTRPEIESMDDLPGKTIGVTALGAGADIYLRRAISEAGLGENDVNIVPVGNLANMVAAYRAGQIDGAASAEPLGTLFEQEFGANIIAETVTPEGTEELYGGPYPFISLWGRTEFIEANPEAVERAVRALHMTNLYLLDASEEELLSAIPDVMRGDQPEVAEGAVLRMRHSFTESPLPTVDDLQRVLDANAVTNDAVRKGIDDGTLLAEDVFFPDAAAAVVKETDD